MLKKGQTTSSLKKWKKWIKSTTLTYNKCGTTKENTLKQHFLEEERKRRSKLVRGKNKRISRIFRLYFLHDAYGLCEGIFSVRNRPSKDMRFAIYFHVICIMEENIESYFWSQLEYLKWYYRSWDIDSLVIVREKNDHVALLQATLLCCPSTSVFTIHPDVFLNFHEIGALFIYLPQFWIFHIHYLLFNPIIHNGYQWFRANLKSFRQIKTLDLESVQRANLDRPFGVQIIESLKKTKTF